MHDTSHLHACPEPRLHETAASSRSPDDAPEATLASLRCRVQQLEILNSINVKVNQSLDLAEILGQTLDEVLRLTGLDAGAIFLRELGLGNLELLAHRGFSEEAARLAAQLGLLDGSCGGAVQDQQLVVVPDISRYRGRRAASLKRERLRTLVHLPLVVKGVSLGSMCVGARCLREFDGEERDLLTAIANQIAVAVENSRLYAELAAKDRLRGELLRKVIYAQEEERRRIARELHDDTSQAVTALLYAAEEAMEVESLAEIKGILGQMIELSRATLDGVHELIFDLRPTMLDHLGLVPALRWLAENRLGPAGVRVVFEADACLHRLPAEAETALFRTLQEAINNIARHSCARNVRVCCKGDGATVTVTVEDDGIGFDIAEVSPAPEHGRGLGLAGMYERASLLGGEVTIDTAPGQGTRVSIRMPLNGQDDV